MRREKPDVCGWATKNGILCSDGRTICQDAFAEDDGHEVPMIWMHRHSDPEAVLGRCILENRKEGVFTYGYFNNTDKAKYAKEAIRHGDVKSFSIFANRIQEDEEGRVTHGTIKEVSLVLAGANPGAKISHPMLAHGDEVLTEVYITTGMEFETDESVISHAEDPMVDGSNKDRETIKDIVDSYTPEERDALLVAMSAVATGDNSELKKQEKKIDAILDSMTEKKKNVFYAMIAESSKVKDEDDEDGEDAEEDEEDTDMAHYNVFEGENGAEEKTLSHDEMSAIFNDVKRYGTLKESFIQHGITDIEQLFPEPKTTTAAPEFITREMGWVGTVMNGVTKSPFSRIKSHFADLTEDEARARGYMKGKLKKEQVFTLLKRTTGPCTIYKKQKLDRDDIIDITDFDVISWIKKEMRLMLDEEIARAILIGDGRTPDSDDKIKEDCIRPIWTDEELYTIDQVYTLAANADETAKAKAFMRNAVLGRKRYKGTGNATLFTTEDNLTRMLLMEDTTGRVIYDSVDKLKAFLRVNRIETVEPMEDKTRTVEGQTRTLEGIIVNLSDYRVGADRGGAVSMFDDFDIDYNQQKYLIETRCSGALVRPYSAIVLESVTAGA